MGSSRTRARARVPCIGRLFLGFLSEVCEKENEERTAAGRLALFLEQSVPSSRMLTLRIEGQTWSTATWGSEGPSVLSLQSTLRFGELLLPRPEVWSAVPAWLLHVVQPPSPTGPV